MQKIIITLFGLKQRFRGCNKNRIVTAYSEKCSLKFTDNLFRFKVSASYLGNVITIVAYYCGYLQGIVFNVVNPWAGRIFPVASLKIAAIK